MLGYTRIAHRMYARYVRIVQGAIRAIVFSARRTLFALVLQYRKQCDFTTAHGRNAHRDSPSREYTLGGH